MNPARTWLALLLLVGTATVQAQEEPQAAEPAGPGLTSPPLVPVPAPGEAPSSRADEEEPSNREPQPPGRESAPTVRPEALPPSGAATPPVDPANRLAMETMGGAAGGALAGAAVGGVGYVTGFILSAAGGSTFESGCDFCNRTVLVGGLAGAAFGVPIGTWLGGRMMGGQGQFAAAMGGSMVGWGGALLGSMLLGEDAGGFAYALLALPVAGAAVGYELSHSAWRRRATAPPEPPVRVVPLVGFGERGPRLGLMGQF